MQDVNPAQFRLLTALLSDEPDLFVVGDPNQSVYGFNGADPSLLYRLPEILRGTRVIRLDENHRCTPQVVAVATAVLRDSETDATVLGEIDAASSSRVDGPVPTVIAPCQRRRGGGVGGGAGQAVTHTPGRRWSSIAILARTNAQLAAGAGGHGGGERARARWPAPNWGRPATCGAAPGATGPSTTTGRTRWPRSTATRSSSRRSTAAKGLQWHTVLIIGLSAGLMPLARPRRRRRVDEERRLLYVALTRAEEELWCSWSEGEGAPGSSGSEPTRSASPWLAPIERTIAQLTKAAAPTAAADVAARVAELRRRSGRRREGG